MNSGRRKPLKTYPIGSLKPVVSLIVFGFALLSIALPHVSAQSVTDIYTFTGTNSSAYPQHVIPVQGRDGRLYGTTNGTGSSSYGAIFKLTAAGAFAQLYAFDNTNGSQPSGGLTLANDGNFYGTTYSGGSAGFGVLFKISSGGGYTVLHNFASGTDGAAPASAPILGTDGNLYGTTYGNASASSTVYKYARASGTLSTIYQFEQAEEGSGVIASLVQATNGNLYGSAYQGGTSNCGTIFEITTSGTLVWTYSFPCLAGGANPVGALIQGNDGNFYGTTSQGGSYNVGTVFKLSQTGTVSVLYSFQSYFNGGADGSTPFGGVIQATDGRLYGSTLAGGSQNQGTLFQITNTGAYKLLYSFSNTGNGPEAPPMQDTSGLFYGTTFEGGKDGFGVVYSLNMGLSPFVVLAQSRGPIGSTAEIFGQGFTGTTSVTFNGTAATTFNVASATYITAVVPSGATTGAVVVTTPNGTLKSNKNFQVIGGTTSSVRRKSTQPISHTVKKTN
jgi:uncharacterized repeat protein (TIGR03803 family)